jgi:RNA polymerase sigma-70 factor (ECF subfamily)
MARTTEMTLFAASAKISPSDGLEHAIERAIDAAQLAWPTFDVEPAAFVQHLATHLPRGQDPVAWLAKVHAGDLYLAHACGRGDRAALAAFEATFGPEIAAYLARDHQPLIDEVRQQLRDKLFVGESARIATYSGNGPLGAWLRKIAVRTALNLRRGQAVAVRVQQRLDEPSPTSDPELDFLKDLYRPVFRAALESSLASLSPKDRNLLRLYFLDGLTLAQIGAMARVHESTIARQMARARQQILEHTERALIERLGVDRDDAQSIIRLAKSRNDFGLSSILKNRAG